MLLPFQGLEGEILYAFGVVVIWIIAALLLAFFALWLLGDGRVSSREGGDRREERQ
jgi:hypothetical protein